MLKPDKITNFKPINIFDIVANRISYVLYGEKQNYILGAIHNAIAAKKIYPGWICRFYIDKISPYCNILKYLDCEILCANPPLIGQNLPDPKTWRMYAIDDKRCHNVIFRDVDSIVSNREKKAVEEWLSSNQTFHRIKDSPFHYTDNLPILSGMWGVAVCRWSLPEITSYISKYTWTYDPQQDVRNNVRPRADEHFIANTLWGEIKKDCMFHGIKDDGFGKSLPLTVAYDNITNFSEIKNRNFIGSTVY